MQPEPIAPSQPDQIALVDWLSFTIPEAASGLADLWDQELSYLLGIGTNELAPTGSGWNGYANRINIGDSGSLGLVAYGGSSQRGSVHVSLSAHGCARIPCWDALAAWGEEHSCRIVRLDLAHDDFGGETINMETAKQWLADGGFDANGRPPKRHLRDDLGTGEGSTLYIGNRKSGKLARLYEKGKQLGDPGNRWFRVEVEWRGKDRVIPWNALTDPSPYLAGAFPCFAGLSARQCKITTMKKVTEMTVDKARRWVKTAAGPSIYALTMVHHGDVFAVFDEVCGDRPPRRLIDLDRYITPHPGGGKGADSVH